MTTPSVSRNWDALFCALERREIVKTTASVLLRSLSDTLAWTIPISRNDFSKLVGPLPEPKKQRLLSEVNSFRRSLGTQILTSLHSPVFRDDLVSLSHSYGLRLANHFYETNSPEARKRLVKRWITSSSFRDLSSLTPFADEAADRTLGMNERKIKTLLGMPQQNLPRSYLWEDASLDRTPEDLFTPYRVIQDLLHTIRPAPNSTIVDLGSGLGRLGFFIGLTYPKVNFLGIELVKERVLQSRKIADELKLSKRIGFEIQDLSDPNQSLPEAEVYFLFNPFTLRTLKRVFKKLREHSEGVRRTPLKLAIVRIGRPPRLIAREPWLRKENESKDYLGWEGKGWALYQTRPKKI